MSDQPHPRHSKKSSDNPLKHLSVLRKAVSKQRHSGHIEYYTADLAEYGAFPIDSGRLNDDKDTLLGLERLVKCKVSSCEFIINKTKQDEHPPMPPMVFSSVLNQTKWDEADMKKLRSAFSSLPPFKVMMAPMHEYGFNDGLTYLTLYQASLKKEGFTANDFFESCPSYIRQEQQLKALVIGYCSGLLNPLPQTGSREKKPTATPTANLF